MWISNSIGHVVIFEREPRIETSCFSLSRVVCIHDLPYVVNSRQLTYHHNVQKPNGIAIPQSQRLSAD